MNLSGYYQDHRTGSTEENTARFFASIQEQLKANVRLRIVLNQTMTPRGQKLGHADVQGEIDSLTIEQPVSLESINLSLGRLQITGYSVRVELRGCDVAEVRIQSGVLAERDGYRSNQRRYPLP